MLSKDEVGILGQYLPMSFSILLPKLFPDDYKTGKELSTFVHEYIHYVQDVSSIYPMQLFFREFEMLTVLGKSIENYENLARPIKLTENDELKIKEHIIWLRYLEGGPKTETEKYGAFVDVCSEIVQLPSETGDSPAKQFRLLFEEGAYNLGAECVMEGMAYAAEKVMGEHFESPFVPYKIAETILRKHFPEITDLEIFTVLDACLLHEIPAVAFLQIIRDCKKRKLLGEANLPNNLFAFLNQNKEIEKSIAAISSGFTDILKNIPDPQFAGSIIYVRDMVENSLNARQKDPAVFVKTFESFKKAPLGFYKNIPSPLILDAKYMSVLSDTSPNFILLHRALKHLLYALFQDEGNLTCPLTRYCDLPIKDKDCDICPWTKANVANSCPYGYAAMILGLKGKTLR